MTHEARKLQVKKVV